LESDAEKKVEELAPHSSKRIPVPFIPPWAIWESHRAPCRIAIPHALIESCAGMIVKDRIELIYTTPLDDLTAMRSHAMIAS
jgi:hypothetical protein